MQEKRPGAHKDEYFIESLARGLSVLASYNPQKSELSLADIARTAGVTTPSALRIGYTLVTLGYLVRNPATKGYRLGPKVLSLGIATLSGMSLVDIAEPYLRGLRDRTEETVKMAVLQDTETLYIARYPSTLHPTTSIYVGSRLVAHMTSIGRAILAFMPEDEARTIVERSRRPALTDKSLTGVEEIMAELRRTRERGYSVNDQGITLEHRSAAAPLINAVGQPVAAINVSVSAQRMGFKEMKRRLVPDLVQTAKQISNMLPSHVEGVLTAE